MTDRKPNRDMTMMAVLSVIIFILLSVITAKCGQVTGQIQSLGGQNLADSTITFSISQTAVPASQSVATTASPVTCGTDTLGNVVGITRPIVLPVASAGAAGTLAPSTTYYIQETYWNASGETQAGLELPFALGGAQNSITITAPLLQPASASGYKVYIQTASGSEKLQATITGWGNATITTLLNVTAPPASNTSTCTFTFNDALIPTYTTYITDITDSTGTEVPGYPQNLYFQGSIVSLATMTPASGLAARFPQPIVSQPTNAITQSIKSPLTLNGFGFTAGFMDTTTCYASQATGADMGAKIQSCINSLPNGGTVDARGISGTQTAASTITCSFLNIAILLGSVQLDSSANPVFNLSANGVNNSNGCAVIGQNQWASVIRLTGGTNDGIKVNGSGTTIVNLEVISKSGTVRTGGAGIHIASSNARVRYVMTARTWIGIWVDAGGSCVNCEDLFFMTSSSEFGPGTGAQAGIQIGPVATGTVTSSNWSGLYVSDDFNDAGIVIDSGADSQSFLNLQTSCGANGSSIHIKDSLAAYKPTLIQISNGQLETCGTGSGVVVDACHDCVLSNLQLGSAGGVTSTNGLLLASGGIISFKFINSRIASFNKECVKITGSSATDIDISHTRIGDCGQLANNTYDSIGVAAGVSGLHFIGNTFAGVLDSPPANLPKNDINIGSGSGTNIYIIGNQWGNINSGNGALFQGATGTGVRVFGNSGTGSVNENTGPMQFSWGCVGAATAGSTLFLVNGNNNAIVASACTDTGGTGWYVVSSPGTMRALFVNDITGGVNGSSGVVTVQKCPGGSPGACAFADQTITCTLGTTKGCNDTTHSFTVAAGDLIRVKYTTQGGETLATVTASLEKQ